MIGNRNCLWRFCNDSDSPSSLIVGPWIFPLSSLDSFRSCLFSNCFRFERWFSIISWVFASYLLRFIHLLNEICQLSFPHCSTYHALSAKYNSMCIIYLPPIQIVPPLSEYSTIEYSVSGMYLWRELFVVISQASLCFLQN